MAGLSGAEEKIIRIACSDVPPEDDCLLRFSDEDARLAEAVASAGVLVPLVLARAAGGPFKLISGFRRLRAARGCGRDTVPVLVLPDAAAPRDLFKTALLLNDPSAYGEIDRATIVAKARDRFGWDWPDLEKLAPLMGLAPSQKLLQEYYAVGRLADPLRARIAAGSIALKTARALAALPGGDRDLIADKVLALCEFSASEGEEVLEWMYDLARKEGKSLAAVLEGESLRQVLSERDRSPRDRGTRLHHLLRGQRFPTLAEWEKAFQKAKQRLETEPGVTLEKTASFEEDYFHLKLRISSPGELRARLEYLARQEALFKELFDRVK